MKPSLEKIAERNWVRSVKRDFNIRAIKFEDPGRRGAPDRIVFLPGGRPLFIEQKRPGEKPGNEQTEYHEWLRSLGYAVWVCYSAGDAYEIVGRCIG